MTTMLVVFAVACLAVMGAWAVCTFRAACWSWDEYPDRDVDATNEGEASTHAAA